MVPPVKRSNTFICYIELIRLQRYTFFLVYANFLQKKESAIHIELSPHIMKNTIYKNTTSSHYRVSRLGLSVHYHHFISFAMYTHNSHRRILAQIFAQVIDIYAQRTCIKIRISSPYAHQSPNCHSVCSVSKRTQHLRNTASILQINISIEKGFVT